MRLPVHKDVTQFPIQGREAGKKGHRQTHQQLIKQNIIIDPANNLIQIAFPNMLTKV